MISKSSIRHIGLKINTQLNSDYQPSARKEEGTSSKEQTLADHWLSRHNIERCHLGLKVHCFGIDATIAVDGSGEGGMALVGSKSCVLNEEELSTNSKQSVDCFATVNPRGGSTSYRLGCG